jgi:hypothetical protein
METFLKVWLAPMWKVLVGEEFIVLGMVFYYFIACHFSITRSSLTFCRFILHSFAKSQGFPKIKKYITWTLQWICESELFTTFEQILEQKKLPSHSFYKGKKNTKTIQKYWYGGTQLFIDCPPWGGGAVPGAWNKTSYKESKASKPPLPLCF